MADRILSRKGQSTLELTLTFIFIVLLVGGIMKIWFWANNQIIQRQLRYNASRVAAGTGSDSYQVVWPVYTPKSLTENDVLLDSPLENRER